MAKKATKCRGSGYSPVKLTKFSFGILGRSDGKCPECGKRISLKRDGSLVAHKA